MAEWLRKIRADEPGERMTLRECDGMEYLTFPALDETGLVSDAFSTRVGGVSTGIYATLNFSYTRGDDPLCVHENYSRMAKALHTDTAHMVTAWQTHTTNIRAVTGADCGKGVERPRDYRDVDGLMTDVPGICLVIFLADCVPLYFLDPVHRAIALSHSGWRGTVARMGAVTLEKMKTEYDTDPADVTACIGPSICRDCYEVGEDVIDEFRHTFPQDKWNDIFFPNTNGCYQLDLWEANRIILQDAGVKPSNIHVTDICTRCNPELLFSHRFTGPQRGTCAAFLCLNK